MKNIKLTNEEYNVLNEISRQTKMDCWFWIHTRKDGHDVIKDLENNRYMSMRAGVTQLNDGLEPDLLDLTTEEWNIYNALLEKLNIPHDVSKPKCPLGGDETNDCDGCCYSSDYHFVDGECVVRKTTTRDFGDECKIILPDNPTIEVNINTFDELEYECMNLIVKYANNFGAKVISKYESDDDDVPISFDLAKEVQDVILSILEGHGLKFIHK